MPIKKLDSIFRPKRIALIGVSNNPDSVGGITLRNLVSGGYNGVVYPVNPKRAILLCSIFDFITDRQTDKIALH